MWSPKRKANGHRNPFYEFMREVAPGDIIFSFKDTLIPAIGIATDFCFESPKPAEFGSAGMNWDRVGWKVPVRWTVVTKRFKPSDHMDSIGALLPNKYSPLKSDGGGLQAVYLTAVPPRLAIQIALLLGKPESDLVHANQVADLSMLAKGQAATELTEWEEHLERQIKDSSTLEDTERTALVRARKGQGIFRENVSRIERACRVTKVDRPEHLRASHCKPWRDCSTSDERLDGENGLLLTPTIDHLFDRGFISFEDKGTLIVSPSADKISLGKMGIELDRVVNVGDFSSGQKEYLDYHREQVFLQSVTG